MFRCAVVTILGRSSPSLNPCSTLSARLLGVGSASKQFSPCFGIDRVPFIRNISETGFAMLLVIELAIATLFKPRSLLRHIVGHERLTAGLNSDATSSLCLNIHQDTLDCRPRSA